MAWQINCHPTPVLRWRTQAPDDPTKDIYGIAHPLQLSATTAVLLVNARATGTGRVDMEAGVDAIVFDRLSEIAKAAPIRLLRNEPAVHPRTGKALTLVKYPLSGGFIPLGARLPDGRPHPHAGTGFGLTTMLGYPAVFDGQRPQRDPDTLRVHEILQFRYDGQKFEVTGAERFTDLTLLPGWEVTNRPLTPAIASGEDLVAGLVAARPGEVHGVGCARWQRRDGAWRLASFVPVTHQDTAIEPSIVRDLDGALLFTTRGFGTERVPEAHLATLDPEMYFQLRVWRSRDEGATWESLICLNQHRNSSPMGLGVTVGGQPFIAANPRRNRAARDGGKGYHPTWVREHLALWPLTVDRRGVDEPRMVLDMLAVHGDAPGGMTWYLDHPMAVPLRLADGAWHCLLFFRVCDITEVVKQGLPVAQTGTWMAEITVPGETPRPQWRFAD